MTIRSMQCNADWDCTCSACRLAAPAPPAPGLLAPHHLLGGGLTVARPQRRALRGAGLRQRWRLRACARRAQALREAAEVV